MKKKITIVLIVLVLLMLACGFGTSINSLPLEGTGDVASPTPNSSTTIPSTQRSHILIPSELPTAPVGTVGDQDSSITADQQRAPSGDRFTFSRYERPFNENTMDIYYPAIDIQGAIFFEDDVWLYAEINLKNNLSSYVLDGKYGFEIDVNTDGGGDWLIFVNQPNPNEWSTNGVEVWFDRNDDVGGETFINSDNTLTDGNGYEELVFSNSKNNDPDLAWGRISPNDAYIVHLAIKKSILEKDATYLVGMYAGYDDFAPEFFDFNDHYTHEQAGAALTQLEYFYPIKELSRLDNTCRMAIGFQPTGNEPGLCPLPPKPGEDPPASSCPAQYVYCINFGNQTVCYCLQP